MAFNEELANRIREKLNTEKHVEEKKMMGGLIFMVNQKMCIGIDIEKNTKFDRLMIRVGKANYQELLGEKGSRVMDFTGKVMKGFLFIDPEGFNTDEDLKFWINKALQFNQML